MPSVPTPPPTDASSSPSALARGPLQLAGFILPLLSYAVVWSAFSQLLTWRHSQLIAGAAGGLVLLLLRAIPFNPSSAASGKTPLSIAMVAVVGTVALALPIAHPEIWSAASICLLLAGITVWLWYPPRGFEPFRSAAQASVALAIAMLVPLGLEAIGFSPWHGPGTGLGSGFPLTGAFDQSETLSAALLYSALTLLVAIWPNPLVPSLTRRGAAVLLGLVCIAALLFAPAIPIAATIAFILAAVHGFFWRANASESDEYVRRQTPRYRSGVTVAFIGMLIAFNTPALLVDAEDQVFAHRPYFEASIALDPSWESADPLPQTVEDELRRAEWRAMWSNLPFGAGVGTWLDETLRHFEPTPGIAPDEEPVRQAGWPDQPRSILAAAVTEHGILAGFIWVLMAAGGLLLARLVIRHSAFPTSVASVIGAGPAIGFAFLPGTSQMAPAYALLLSWFLLCAPLARANARAALRLVPAVSSDNDPRKPPRGRIFILLVPAFVVGWFAISHLRWSQQAHRGYLANAEGNLESALQHFQQANQALPHPATLFNEAKLLEALDAGESTERVTAAYEEALSRRPNAPSYLVARAQWRLRQHQAWVEGEEPVDTDTLDELAQRALDDVERALIEAPLWALAHQLRLESLILLGELDEATQRYEESSDRLMSPENRNELRMLRIRQLAWLEEDREAATELLDQAELKPAHPITRYFMQHERGRLVFWEQSRESPYTPAIFHEGHIH